MLKLPQKYTQDEKANSIIAWYLNQNILGLVQDEIVQYECQWGRTAEEEDPAFCDAVSEFFPESYQKENMGKVFFGLRALLESEYIFVPELIMEYVMYQLIRKRIEISDDLGIETMEPVPDREYVISVLKRECPDDAARLQDGEEEYISWQEKLERLEDLHYYEDMYFWDEDYLQLDFLTEEELLESPISEYLGINNIRFDSRKYGISPEWLK